MSVVAPEHTLELKKTARQIKMQYLQEIEVYKDSF